MPPPAHVSIIRHVLHVGIADVSLTRPHPVGAVLPASDLIVVSILTRAHDDFLLTRCTVSRNIVTWSSASGASAAVLLCRMYAVTGFHSALARSFSLVLLWDFACPLSQTIRPLRSCHACSCPCSSAAHRSALAQDCCQCTVVFS